ncbi:8-amino-7-oxononanoate synthase [Halothiobacillus sp. DCM-1]|uniref:8-amino-7-oxononanoate synthase n=1 Tax=Halothiobacillus sp. DCM-1 TaxID=3112558 RepID=UPI00324CD42C
MRRGVTAQTPQGAAMQIDGQPMLSFCSNDYLGLANHPQIVAALAAGAERWGVGAGAAHLINGHFEPHAELETALAGWLRVDRALLFSTGYMANLAVVGGLVGRGDTVIADRLNHASLVDAAQLSGAKLLRYRHNDPEDCARQLARARGTRMIVTDGVFSMDGDAAPLAALLELAERHDAWLVIDDAHGFGVWGAGGRGTLREQGLCPGSPPERLLQVGTLGKAFGTAGAFIAGAQMPLEVLRQRARPYLFTTAAPPALAVATQASLQLIQQGDDLRAAWRARVAQLRTGLADHPGLLASATPIQPLVVGSAPESIRLAEALKAEGLFVPAIRPPTVPPNSARLRITLSASHSEAMVDTLIAALRALIPQASG